MQPRCPHPVDVASLAASPGSPSLSSPKPPVARSLTVQHEENVSTSPLFTGFLLFAVAWLLIGGVIAAQLDAPADGVEVTAE